MDLECVYHLINTVTERVKNQKSSLTIKGLLDYYATIRTEPLKTAKQGFSVEFDQTFRKLWLDD